MVVMFVSDHIYIEKCFETMLGKTYLMFSHVFTVEYLICVIHQDT